MNKKLLTTALAFVLTVAGRAESVSDAFCEALNVSGLTFTTGGDAAWTVTTADSTDGESSVQSGAIASSQSTWFQTTIEGPRLISYMWKISSGGRYLTVSVDGVSKRQIYGYNVADWSSNYTTPWCKQYVYIDSGLHVIRWTFENYQSGGEDLARIDKLELGEVCEEITLPSNLTTLENYAFRGSRSLKSVILPSSLTAIPADLFNGCTALTRMSVPAMVETIGDRAFRDCTGLKEVSFPSGLTTLGGEAFYGCTALESIDVPDSVTAIGGSAFRCCSALKTAKLPAGLTATSDALFMDCTALESVTMPTAPIKIENHTFRNCRSLKSIDVPETVVTIGAYAFNQCDALTDITLPNDLCVIGERAFQCCRALKALPIPDNVTMLGEAVLEFCDELESANIPLGVQTVPRYMFQHDFKLRSVSLHNGISKIEGNAFCDCPSLESCVIPSAVTAIPEYCFADCVRLKPLEVPANIQSIGTWAFRGCAGLETLVVPDAVTEIQNGAFGYCSNLVSVTFHDRVTVIGSEAFCHCSKLSTVNLPKQLVTLGAYAFCDCPLLNHVTIPGTVSEIQHEAFAGDTALEDLTLGEGIQTIAYWAFSGCSALRRVEVPVSVKTLGIYRDWISYPAFDGCSNLRSILFKGPPPANVEYYAGIIGSCGGVFAREYGRQWIQKLGINNFTGYSQNSILSAKVISSKIRENDPTVMDIVYKVTSSQPTVKVRALAFEDGERSFAKVIRPETFIDGTAANVGDSVTANVEHTISWRVSSDWQTRLAKLQVEVFACEGELLPLELMTIPASDAYGKMKVTWNALSDSQWLDALYWLYASKDAGLTLENGVLKETSSGDILVSGTSVKYSAGSYWVDDYDRDGNYVGWHYENQGSAPEYVFGKMGYTLIENEVLTYVNDELRLGLSPSGARQYGYKIVP